MKPVEISPRLPFFDNLHFWLKLVFVSQFPLNCYWYCYNQKQPSGDVLQKRCSYKFCKIHKKRSVLQDSFLMKFQVYIVLLYQKKRFRYRRFLVNSRKFLINIFCKESFGEVLLVLFCLLSHRHLLFFEKRCYTYFPVDYFLGLIDNLEWE